MKITKIILFIFSFFILGGTLVSAETISSGVSGDAVLVADVNLYNAKVVSQEGNKINLSFDVANGAGSQAGLLYSIKLIKQIQGEGQYLMDEYTSDEVFSLGSNSSISKEVTYIAPSSLTGKYKLLISINNSSGLMLALGFTNDVTLESTVSSVMILSESCFLTVLNEAGSPKYNLTQGVDIDASETINLNCIAVNESKEDITATPVYETHFRSTSGEVVAQTGGDITPISFMAGESKEISLALPKATTPQAYDVVVNLNSKEVSNKIVVHYVLRGASATIQNFSIDKDSYLKGETANVSLSWTPSADSFPGNRLGSSGSATNVNLSLSIKSGNRNCIEPVSQVVEYTNSGILNLPISIIKDCNKPTATIELKDDQGNVLDSKILSFNTDAADTNNNTLYIVLGILIILGVSIYIINLNKKQNETTI